MELLVDTVLDMEYDNDKPKDHLHSYGVFVSSSLAQLSTKKQKVGKFFINNILSKAELDDSFGEGEVILKL